MITTQYEPKTSLRILTDSKESFWGSLSPWPRLAGVESIASSCLAKDAFRRASSTASGVSNDLYLILPLVFRVRKEQSVGLQCLRLSSCLDLQFHAPCHDTASATTRTPKFLVISRSKTSVFLKSYLEYVLYQLWTAVSNRNAATLRFPSTLGQSFIILRC